eukprot:690988-Alexandrium_andersonii.AAC.1
MIARMASILTAAAAEAVVVAVAHLQTGNRRGTRQDSIHGGGAWDSCNGSRGGGCGTVNEGCG